MHPSGVHIVDIMAPRDRRLNVRLTLEEHEQLRELAQHFGVAASDIIRMCIRHYHAMVKKELMQSAPRRHDR